jgi:hypothetical protein
MFILEFKQWIEDLLTEALLSKDQSKLFSIILNHIKLDPLVNIVGVGKKNINQLISSITGSLLDTFSKTSINDDVFLKAFLAVVLRRAFQSKDFSSIIDDNFFTLSKQDKELQIDAVIGYISMFLEDLDEKSYIFGEILNKNNGDLSKSINDFLTNPRGIHSHLGLENKPLFKKVLEKPPQEKVIMRSLDNDSNTDSKKYIPTEDELLSKRDVSDKPKKEFDDVSRIEQQEFQRKLLSVTPVKAKENLNINLKRSLDENKDAIVNPDNLDFFAKNPKSKKPEINDTNNYLKIKALYDISTKFEKSISELEGHSEIPSYEGRSYSTLPTRKDVLDSDSYFSKLKDDQWINLISKYILSHYNAGKDPKIAISFFTNLYGAPSDMWKKVIDTAVKKSLNVKKDLLEKDFPLTQDDFEFEDEKVKKDKEKFKRTWMNMSGRLAVSAKSDLHEFLPDSINPYDDNGNPKEEGSFDKDGYDRVSKILDDFYYNKFYGNTSVKSGSKIDDKEKEVANKSQNFQTLVKLYRILLGLSAIEVAQVDSKTIPICKQLQIWLDFSFRDPNSNVSVEELNKIKDIKKIKELLDSSENIIKNIFKKPLNAICNNDKFDDFEIQDDDWKSSHEEYLAALNIKDLPPGYSIGSRFGFKDFLKLKNSKNKEDIEKYKYLISKGKESLKNEPSLAKKAEEKEYLDIAEKIVALRRGIGDPYAIAEKLKAGLSVGSPLWNDLQIVNSKFTPPDVYTPRSKEEEEFRVTGSTLGYSANPQPPETERIGSEWKPKTPEVSSPDPKEKEQMIAAAKQRAQAAADQRRAYYARNLNKDTGRVK